MHVPVFDFQVFPMDQYLKITTQCSAYCAFCGTEHFLDTADAVPGCLELIDILDSTGRIDFAVSADEADPAYSTDYLFGPARGQMFGVMLYLDDHGDRHAARAFSGQYNGRWNAPGFVPPIIDEDEFFRLTRSTEFRIKEIGREMAELNPKGGEYATLAGRRRELSRELMRRIHSIYRVRNFRGEVRLMPDIACTCGGLPTGTGDCCAPKLLNFAAVNGFTPVSIAEFYYGSENRSGTRKHKLFYSSCKDKCGLILGFMLCGL